MLLEPLSVEQLREIQARHRGDPDVTALLWEVRRLHGLLLRANQIQAMLPPKSGLHSLDLVLGEFRLLFADEPVIMNEAARAKR